MNTISRLDKGSVSPSFQASSEKEIGTAKAKAPIATCPASSKLKLNFIVFPNYLLKVADSIYVTLFQHYKVYQKCLDYVKDLKDMGTL